MVKRLMVGAAAAGAAAAALLFGGALGGAAPAGSASAPAPPARAAAGTEGQIAQLQERLRVGPFDAGTLGALGLAYQQRARETGDPAYYTRSGEALRRALAVAPHDLVATSGLGSLALSRHRFREALALGRRARAISPTTARGYGVVGDALVELGRYREAFRTFDAMASMRPGLASYARVAHARMLIGDVPGAVEAMTLAADAAAGLGEPEAWTRVQLALLHWSVGRLGAASAEARQALAAFPGYAYALDVLARVAAARGGTAAAIALEQQAVDRIPLPQHVALLGDLYRAAGDERRARRQYATIGVIERLQRANGVRTDLETALFDIDHGLRLRSSLALAREAQRQRPSIDGDDVLAWALYRNGRCFEALPYARHATRLGTKDALKIFHRGMIQRCLGNRAAAGADLRRALRLNPHFSVLWAPVARSYA